MSNKREITEGQLAICVFVAVALIVVALFSMKIVDVGKEEVGATFGSVHSEPLTSGFYFVNPLATFEEYDIQQMTYTFDNIGIPAQDNLKTSLDAKVTGFFIPGQTVNVREQTGSAVHFLTTHYRPKVRAILIEVGKELAPDSQAFYGKNTLAQLEDLSISRLNAELNPLGYTITAIKFSDINLPTVVTNAVVKTKRRQQEIKEQKANLSIAELKAQEVTKQAEAQRDASKAHAEAKRIQADAEAYRITQVATAQAKANEKLAKTATANLIELKRVETWNGQLPQTMLGKETGTLLSIK